MKTTEDKLRFKNHFFKLGQSRIIPSHKTEFYQVFWTDPESSNDIYELLTPYDIKTIRDQNRINFIILIRVLCYKIVEVSEVSVFNQREILNCVRFLTKLLPILYETPNYHELESKIFWDPSFDPLQFIKPTTILKRIDESQASEGSDVILGSALLNGLVSLLFVKDFTIASNSAIWEPGIGSSSKYSPPNTIHDSNRAEILKLLLTLISTTFYKPPSQIIASGSRFVTVLVTCIPRVKLLTLVCSLLNLVCRTSRDEKSLIFPNSKFTEVRYLSITYAIQLISIMIAYPIPSNENVKFLTDLNLISSKPHNLVRLYMGKLHKEAELSFVTSSLLNILKSPLSTANEGSFFKSNNQPSLWSIEVVILIWELLQCNKNFRKVIHQRHINELTILLIYYIETYQEVPKYKNLVQICCYLLLYISSDLSEANLLFEPIPKFYETLPTTFKLNPGPVTTRDFLVTVICNMLSNNITTKSRVSSTLVEILYNLIPAVSSTNLDLPQDPTKKLNNHNPSGGLSYSTCFAITSLLSQFSSRTFLLENSFNLDLLALIFTALATAIIKHPKPSRMLLFSILKNEKIYNELWTIIYSFDSEYFCGDTLKFGEKVKGDGKDGEEDASEDDLVSPTPSNDTEAPSKPESSVDSEEIKAIEDALRPKLPTGMTERKREKFLKESPLNRTWGGNQSLRVILTIIIPHLKVSLKYLWSSRNGSNIDSLVLVKHIEQIDFDPIVSEHKGQINYDFLPTTPFESLKFSWTYLSLGWYMSILYGEVYNSVDNVKVFTGNNNKIMRNISTSIASVSKFTSGWTSFINKGVSQPEANEASVDYVENSLTNINVWAQTSIKLFRIEASPGEGFFGSINKIANQDTPGIPGGVNDMANTLVRRISDFRLNNNSRASLSSGLTTPVEEQESMFGKSKPRNSVTSLQSFNTLNRTRSNTPRNSISVERQPIDEAKEKPVLNSIMSETNTEIMTPESKRTNLVN